ncbi:MAG: TetR/AcrR family transcriptional regulator [Myxococcota bacterium]
MPRDATATKQRILDAALQCFAEGGFAGTSTRTIAQTAGVSLPLLQRYFGNKQGLFNAALRRMMDAYSALQSDQWARAEDDPRFYVDGLSVLFGWYRDRPVLCRLAAWARLEGVSIDMEDVDAYWTRLAERIEAGKKHGLVRPDADVDAWLVAVDALTKGYWERRHGKGPQPVDVAGLDERMLRTMLSFSLRSLLVSTVADAVLE